MGHIGAPLCSYKDQKPSTTLLTTVNLFERPAKPTKLPVWSTTEHRFTCLHLKTIYIYPMDNFPCVDWRVTHPNVRKNQIHRLYNI